MDRFLRDASGTHTLYTYNSSGVLTDLAGIPTVVIRDSAGTSVATPTASKPSTGTYTIPLTPTLTATLDTYAVTWTETGASPAQVFRTSFEVVGGFLFTDAELRAFDATFNDAGAVYTAAKIAEAREYAEERLESLCGVSFVQRGYRETLDGPGGTDLITEKVNVTAITSGSIDGTALTSTELADIAVYPEGVLRRKTLGAWGTGDRNVSVLYVHGYSQPPEPVRIAAMSLARERLMATADFRRAETISTDVGVLRQSIAGRDGYTGLPDVDQIINEYGRCTFRL